MKKRYKIVIGVLVLLIAGRIYLPYWATDYVNKVLQDVPGYTGSITDVDIHLYKGAYAIDSLEILKADSSVFVPFFASNRIDLSIQWSALFDGSIVGEIDLINPVLNFVAAEDASQAQYGEDVDWTEPLKELIPVSINRFGIKNGSIFFRNYESTPEINLSINDLALEMTNLTNASSNEEKLPSSLTVSATSIGEGVLSVTGGLNVIKKVPDMDLDLEFEGVDFPALNDFLKVYALIDAEEGVFNLYSELVINDGELTGYVKPLIRDMKIVNWENDKDQPLRLIWESVAGLFFEVFENQKKDQFASKIPFSGDMNDPSTRVFPAIWSVFSNAFVEAFKKSTDDAIDIGKKNEEED